MSNPTLEQCYQQGVTHAAYGWACSPWGHYSNEQAAAYQAGFDGAPLDTAHSVPRDGEAAYRAGFSAIRCPYRWDTVAAAEWRQDWDKCRSMLKGIG
jgi:hypothetical protein